MPSLSIRINIYKIFVKWEGQIIKYFSKPLTLVNTRRVGIFVFERNLAILGKIKRLSDNESCHYIWKGSRERVAKPMG